MKNKKSIMIVLLFVFIVIIGWVIVKIDKKSSPKTMADSAQSQSSTEIKIKSVLKDGATVRKSTELAKPDMNNILEIKDNFFIEQTNDIFFNTEDYVDKTIKIEGLIYSYQDFVTGDICYAVVRNTPGCCGADGLAGLDIRFNGEYPDNNTWVEVIGVIKTDKVSDSEIPIIQVASMNETDVGTTFVQN